ncbi:Rieske domain-containing protein-like [Oculina patagonica]
MEESSGKPEDLLYLNVEGIRYEDLPELASDITSNDAEEVPWYSTGTLGKRKSRRRTGRLVTVNNQKIALFKYKGTVYAVDEMCPHMGGPLHIGDIEELGQAALPCIVCPWHSWKYCLQTGHLKVPHKKDIKVGTYPVRVTKKGEMFLGFRSLSKDFFNGGIDF